VSMSSAINYNALILKLLTQDDPLKIPFDVTYKVYDDEEHYLGEVSCHKFILGLVSPVFKAGFYTSHFEKNETIKISRTSLQAFQTMVDFLYLKTIDFNKISIENLFKLVDLAECYNITELTDAIHEHMVKMHIPKEELLSITKTAEEFQEFEEAHKILVNNVVTTLDKSLGSKKDVLSFCKELALTGNETRGIKLLSSLLEDLPSPGISTCPNCNKYPCRNNSNIESCGEIMIGTRVKPNYDNLEYWRNNPNTGILHFSFRVKSIEGEYIKLGSVKKYPLKFKGKPNYQFCCQK